MYIMPGSKNIPFGSTTNMYVYTTIHVLWGAIVNRTYIYIYIKNYQGTYLTVFTTIFGPINYGPP